MPEQLNYNRWALIGAKDAEKSIVQCVNVIIWPA